MANLINRALEQYHNHRNQGNYRNKLKIVLTKQADSSVYNVYRKKQPLKHWTDRRFLDSDLLPIVPVNIIPFGLFGVEKRPLHAHTYTPIPRIISAQCEE